MVGMLDALHNWQKRRNCSIESVSSFFNFEKSKLGKIVDSIGLDSSNAQLPFTSVRSKIWICVPQTTVQSGLRCGLVSRSNRSRV